MMRPRSKEIPGGGPFIRWQPNWARLVVVLRKTLECLHGSVDDLARELMRVLGVNETDRRALELILLAGEKVTTPGLLARRLGLTAAGTTISAQPLGEARLRQSIATSDRSPTSNRGGHRSRVSPNLGTPLPMLDQGAKVLLGYTAAEIALIAGFISGSSRPTTNSRQLVARSGSLPSLDGIVDHARRQAVPLARRQYLSPCGLGACWRVAAVV